MTSFVKFTPIIGANSNSKSFSYLLEIDDSKILLDCGSITSVEYSSRLEQ
jgi:Cft2 family RNA processing exonuclease